MFKGTIESAMECNLPKLKIIWWNCKANEVKRQPSAVTNPPITEISLVDFVIHNEIVTGEKNNPIDADSVAKIPKINFALGELVNY